MSTDYPLIRVPSIIAPAEAMIGSPVSMSFVWHNHGGDGWAWWRVVDLNTYEEYIPVSTGGATPDSELLVQVPSIIMPWRLALKVRIEVGHIEDYGGPSERYVLDESHDVAVRIPWYVWAIPIGGVVVGVGIYLATRK